MPLTDRRHGRRFDFVGGQWGSVHELEPLRVRNIGLTGLLIESATTLPLGSIHAIRLAHRSNTVQCYVAVRHLSSSDDMMAGQPCLVGLEFVDLDDQAKAFMHQMMADRAAPPLPAED